jgi:hypothetical protein
MLVAEPHVDQGEPRLPQEVKKKNYMRHSKILYGSPTTTCCCRLQLRLPAFRIVCSSEVAVSWRQALEQLDKKLAEGDEKAALAHAKDLQGKPGGLQFFGAARQVGRISYWLS